MKKRLVIVSMFIGISCAQNLYGAQRSPLQSTTFVRGGEEDPSFVLWLPKELYKEHGIKGALVEILCVIKKDDEVMSLEVTAWKANVYCTSRYYIHERFQVAVPTDDFIKAKKVAYKE